MNRTLLRIALLPAVAVTLYAVLFRRNWVGEWNWTIDMIGGTATLVGPVLASVGALAAINIRRMSPLLDSTSRPFGISLRSILEVWLVGCVAWAVAAIVALSMTQTSTHGGPFTWWALALGPAVLLVAASVGYVVGFFAPFRVVALLVAPAYFAVGAVAPFGLRWVFRQGPVTGSLAGLDFDRFSALALLLFAAASAGVAAAGLSLIGRPRRKVVAVGGTASLAVLLILAIVGGGDRFAPGMESATRCSSVDGTTTCVAPSNVVRLADLSQTVSNGAGALRSMGASVPSRFDALVPHAEPTIGRGMLADIMSTDPFAVVMYPSPCDAWLNPNEPPPSEVSQAQFTMILLMERASGTRMAEYPGFDEWVSQSSSTEQRNWLAATYADLTSCDLASIALPY